MQSVDKATIIDEIRRKVDELQDLPTLPSIALEVRKVASDSKSGVAALVDVIEEDMTLTGRILRIANSAYYGVPRKIDNLKMALVILGMNEIANLVLTISIFKLFPEEAGKSNFNLPKFWHHSASCAELTVGLYTALRLPVPTSAYVAGLLHDIGKLVISQFFAGQYQKCLETATAEGIGNAEAELKVIGVDHGHVGSWLTKRWNLPEEINQAIAQHHIHPPDIETTSLPVIIQWADHIAHLIEDREQEEAIALLNSNAAWNEWFNEKVTTAQLVETLYERLDRSLTMVNILQ